ncbi:hypothetical protein BROUX41_000096 [Berkeleyomyces rouxiae]
MRLAGDVAAGTSSRRALLRVSQLVALDKILGVRPIAAGEIFYCLATRAVLFSAGLHGLLPNQLGVGNPGGVDPAIHLMREAVEGDNLRGYERLTQLDFSNAVNTVSRKAMAEAVRRFRPDLVSMARWAYDEPSLLITVESNRLVSTEGILLTSTIPSPMSTLLMKTKSITQREAQESAPTSKPAAPTTRQAPSEVPSDHISSFSELEDISGHSVDAHSPGYSPPDATTSHNDKMVPAPQPEPPQAAINASPIEKIERMRLQTQVLTVASAHPPTMSDADAKEEKESRARASLITTKYLRVEVWGLCIPDSDAFSGPNNWSSWYSSVVDAFREPNLQLRDVKYLDESTHTRLRRMLKATVCETLKDIVSRTTDFEEAINAL